MIPFHHLVTKIFVVVPAGPQTVGFFSLFVGASPFGRSLRLLALTVASDSLDEKLSSGQPSMESAVSTPLLPASTKL